MTNNKRTYNVGEKLIWVHIDEKTGKRLNEMVTVMHVKIMNKGNGKPHYLIRTVKGDAGNCWHDELFRFQQE